MDFRGPKVRAMGISRHTSQTNAGTACSCIQWLPTYHHSICGGTQTLQWGYKELTHPHPLSHWLLGNWDAQLVWATAPDLELDTNLSTHLHRFLLDKKNIEYSDLEGTLKDQVQIRALHRRTPGSSQGNPLHETTQQTALLTGQLVLPLIYWLMLDELPVFTKPRLKKGVWALLYIPMDAW